MTVIPVGKRDGNVRPKAETRSADEICRTGRR
jgi:hypothetical protein